MFYRSGDKRESVGKCLKYLGNGTSELLFVGPYESADSYGRHPPEVRDGGELAAAASSCM
jgi:hypothetical protein